MIRAVIVAATIAALIALWIDRPTPVKSVQVDYCWGSLYAAAKNSSGDYEFFWGEGYQPCSQIDRFENT